MSQPQAAGNNPSGDPEDIKWDKFLNEEEYLNVEPASAADLISLENELRKLRSIHPRTPLLAGVNVGSPFLEYREHSDVFMGYDEDAPCFKSQHNTASYTVFEKEREERFKAAIAAGADLYDLLYEENLEEMWTGPNCVCNRGSWSRDPYDHGRFDTDNKETPDNKTSDSKKTSENEKTH